MYTSTKHINVMRTCIVPPRGKNAEKPRGFSHIKLKISPSNKFTNSIDETVYVYIEKYRSPLPKMFLTYLHLRVPH